ncbi:hypothetical protein [Ruegeria arenilitoris]|uniref:hypothetical protein n=1 Tax=Ruegeria arenilitoris TaxID=1173585 RepID=UPI001C2BA748|nr:hypothetical protein [Ruegeria arenilitoris]
MTQLTEEEIWRSDLAEDEKEQLARAWEETLVSERRKVAKGLRNETVREYYEILHERTREDEEEFDR